MLRIAPATRSTVPELSGSAAWKHFLWFFYDAVGCVASLRERFGSIAVLREHIPFRKRSRQCVFVSSAELSRQVLSDLDTFASGGVIVRGPKGSALNNMRRGLITVNDHKHRDQRKLLGPMFMPKAVREYFPSMVNIVRHGLDGWQFGRTVNVFSEASRWVLRMSVESLLPGEDPAAALKLAEATNELMDKSFSPGVVMFPLNVVGTPYHRLLKRAERLEAQALQLIDSRPRNPESPATMIDLLIRYQLSLVSRPGPGHSLKRCLVRVCGLLVSLLGIGHRAGVT